MYFAEECACKKIIDFLFELVSTRLCNPAAPNTEQHKLSAIDSNLTINSLLTLKENKQSKQ